MEYENNFEIQEKIQKVESVKRDFKKEVLKKIGDVLINEIQKVIDENKDGLDVDKNCVIIFQIPNFLKSILTLFNKNNLMNETAIFYIFLNLEGLSPINENKYNKNIQKILKVLNDSSEIKNLIILDSENADASQFLIEIKVPEDLYDSFMQFGEKAQPYFVFAALAIIKWLGLLSPKYEQEYEKYENFFQNNRNN